MRGQSGHLRQTDPSRENRTAYVRSSLPGSSAGRRIHLRKGSRGASRSSTARRSARPTHRSRRTPRIDQCRGVDATALAADVAPDITRELAAEARRRRRARHPAERHGRRLARAIGITREHRVGVRPRRQFAHRAAAARARASLPGKTTHGLVARCLQHNHGVDGGRVRLRCARERARRRRGRTLPAHVDAGRCARSRRIAGDDRVADLSDRGRRCTARRGRAYATCPRESRRFARARRCQNDRGADVRRAVRRGQHAGWQQDGPGCPSDGAHIATGIGPGP